MTKITTFLKAINEKLTENANEVIETKIHVTNNCGYTNRFINGQMAVAHKSSFFVCDRFPQGEFASGKFL